MKTVIRVPVVAAALFGATTAHAQGDIATAQGLFDQAKLLVGQGKLAEACPKFLASFKLDAKPGTAVNLADCYERAGQLASAWARYLEAAALAQRAGQAERERYANDHAAALEPKLARLTISAPAATPGLEVLRDGTPLDAPILGTPVPIDPGSHRIEARAPGKKLWSKTVDIPAGPAKIAVDVPPLEAAPAGADVPQAAPAGSSPRRTAGFVASGVGGAGLLVGAITGGLAVSKHASLAPMCPQGTCTNQKDAVASFHTLGTVADVGLFVGAAIAVTGIVLLVTAPKPSPPKQAWVTPVVGPRFVGATGRFR